MLKMEILKWPPGMEAEGAKAAHWLLFTGTWNLDQVMQGWKTINGWHILLACAIGKAFNL